MSNNINGVDLESIGQLLEAIKSNKELAKVNFLATSKWNGGTQTEVSISELHAGGENIARPDRNFKLIVDEPAQLGGQDEAPNPVEYLAAALCGCLTAGIATNAALFDTELKGIEVTIKADCDLHGILGLDKSVPNGLTHLDYTVKLTGANDEEKMLKSKETLDKKSFILNTLSKPFSTSTKVEIAKG